MNDGLIRTMSADTLKTWLLAWLANEQRVGQETIDPGESFLSYGVDSVQAMSLVGDLETALGRRLPATLVWDYPTIDALAEHLADQAGEQPAEIGRVSDQEADRLMTQYLGKP
jgi:acyl carrier protein